ncbi:MAG: CAAD domain-containing protein [Halothece sp. Uz-M2-17]|nr:CAAD domain-containing protein [Halothece sp. Uz-M2-17]
MESTTENKEKQAQQDINTEAAGELAPAGDQPQWQQQIQPVVDVISKLPNYLGQFFADYQQPLLVILLFIAAFITVKVTFAVLGAINGIPLLSPVFELVGLGYTGWFVYRYLLRASTRAELTSEFNNLKGQVLGNSSQKS